MTQGECEECMKDLDANHDGKISLEEFQSWWLTGRRGLSPFMRKMLGLKLKAVKLM
jgi:hypothetical protein